MSRCDRFMSRAAAKKARQRMKNRHGLNAYECPTESGWWHLGHLPQKVKAGEATRDDLTPPRKPRPPTQRRAS